MVSHLHDVSRRVVHSVLIARGGQSIRRVTSMLQNADEDFSVVNALPPNRHLLDIARRMHPDIVIMPLRAPFVSGIRIVRAITSEMPVHVVVLCSQNDASWAVAALRAGAAAYLFDHMPEADMLRMIRTLCGTRIAEPPAAPSSMSL